MKFQTLTLNHALTEPQDASYELLFFYESSIHCKHEQISKIHICTFGFLTTCKVHLSSCDLFFFSAPRRDKHSWAGTAVQGLRAMQLFLPQLLRKKELQMRIVSSQERICSYEKGHKYEVLPYLVINTHQSVPEA